MHKGKLLKLKKNMKSGGIYVKEIQKRAKSFFYLYKGNFYILLNRSSPLMCNSYI